LLEPPEIGEPDLDERPDGVLEPGLSGELQRLLVGLAHLREGDALLEPVVTGDEELLDARSDLFHLLLSSRKNSNFFFQPMEAAAHVPDNKARVLVADDHRLFAEALEAILATNDRIDVIGHAANGQEAVELWMALRPDVTLMDISMPVMDGFEATARIREHDPHASILMLTGSNSRSDVDRARQVGVAGYVTKDRIAAELIEAILELVHR
jgi:CheY-like chemotaxis protein